MNDESLSLKFVVKRTPLEENLEELTQTITELLASVHGD